MTELPRYWYILARLYQNKDLELAEVAKVLIINTSIGLIEDKKTFQRVGINVLDNSQIHSALVFGVIYHQPLGTLISYPEIGKLLLLHGRTVGIAVKKLIADGNISKEDFGASGSTYTILEVPNYPRWVLLFTQAIVELSQNAALEAEINAECEEIQFKRGMETLKEELREKFYRRKKPQSSD